MLNESRSARRARLIEQYGEPETVDRAETIHLFGLREVIHPRDTAAFRYATMEAARAYAQVNRLHHGHKVHGPIMTDNGPVALLDLRESIRSMGGSSTDPTFPDDPPKVS
jgi:hypothetical protein